MSDALDVQSVHDRRRAVLTLDSELGCLPTELPSGSDVEFHHTSFASDIANDATSYYEIVKAARSSGRGGERDAMLCVIEPGDRTRPSTLTNKSGDHIHIAPATCQLYGFETRDQLLVSRLKTPLDRAYMATRVEMHFSNVFISRGDMLRISLSLVGKPVHEGQMVGLPGSKTLKIRVAEIWAGPIRRKSALVSVHTTVFYRSASAKVYLFLQLSSESWSFDSDGSLFVEKAVLLFLPELFARWAAGATNHIVSIVLFSRVYYAQHEVECLRDRNVGKDPDDRPYRDFFQSILDLEANPDWDDVLETIKTQGAWVTLSCLLTRVVFAFQERVLLSSRPRADGSLAGTISAAHDGNILEAVNLALNAIYKVNIVRRSSSIACLTQQDRDVQRTGAQMVLLTPGTCQFAVDKHLLRLTTERLNDVGATLDCVSLANLPLHQVPVFRYKSEDPTIMTRSQTKEDAAALMKLEPLYYDPPANSLAPKFTFFSIPSWLDASFYSRQPDRPFRQDRFMPRAKMGTAQSLGIVEHENAAIRIPALATDLPSSSKWAHLDASRRRRLAREEYDAIACGGSLQHHDASTPLVGGSGYGDDSMSESVVSETVHGGTPAPPRSSTHRLLEQTSQSTLGTADSRPSSIRSARLPVRPALGGERTVSSSTVSLATSAATRASVADSTPSPAPLAASAAPPGRQPGAAAMTALEALRKTSAPSVREARSTSGGWGAFFRGRPVTKAPATIAAAPVTATTRASATSGRAASTVRDPSPASTVGRTDPSARKIEEALRSSSPRRRADSPARSTRSADTPTDPNGHSRRASRSERRPKRPVRDKKPVQPTRTNPSNPRANHTSYQHEHQRWKRRSDQRTVKWKSLCTPATLPLSVETAPFAEGDDATSHSYEIPVRVHTSTPFLRPSTDVRLAAGRLLREMVFHRMTQGLQIVVGEGMQQDPDDSDGSDDMSTAGYRAVNELLPNAADDEGRSLCLASSWHMHTLRYDRQTQQIFVTIHARAQTWAQTDRTYAFELWTRDGDRFTTSSATFSYPDIGEFDWQRMDRMIAGLVEPRLDESLGIWRLRCLIVPGAPTKPRSEDDAGPNVANEETWMEEGLQRLYSLISNARWQPASGIQSEVSNMIYADGPGLFSDGAVDVLNDPSRQLDDAAFGPTAASMTAATLASFVRTNVTWKERKWKTQKVPGTALGSEILDCFETLPDVPTRDAAAGHADRLLKLGIITRVGGVGEKEAVAEKKELEPSAEAFEDNFAAYQLAPQYASASTEPEMAQVVRVKRAHGRGSTSASPSAGSSSAHAGDLPTFDASAKAILELEPSRRTDRCETTVLHFDIFTSPRRVAMHLQYDWISTSKYVEEHFSALGRLAERYGRKLVETSTLQVVDVASMSPLSAPTRIVFAVPPPRVEGQHAEHYYHVLLDQCGYLMDIEADHRYPSGIRPVVTWQDGPCATSQFVHSTGLVLVQIGSLDPALEPSLLFWRNRLQLGRDRLGATGAIKVHELCRELTTLCADGERLRAIWDATTPPPAPIVPS